MSQNFRISTGDFKIGQGQNKIYVSPIKLSEQKQKEPNTILYDGLPEAKQRLLLLLSLEKKLQSLLDAGTLQVAQASQVQLFIALKQQLEILQKEEVFESVEYAHNLSLAWRQIRDDYTPFYLLKIDPSLSRLIQMLFDEFNCYPYLEEHSLGYYLEHYAGENWLPFPFIEILKELKLSYRRAPHSSYLTLWVRLLEEIIGSFQSASPSSEQV